MSEMSVVEQNGCKCIVFKGELTLHEVERLSPRFREIIEGSRSGGHG